MSQREVWQATITDTSGNIVPDAQITVYEQDGITLATIYGSLTGGTKANPFIAGTDGVARFYAESGRYVVRAFKDSQIAERVDVDLSMKALREDLSEGNQEVLGVSVRRNVIAVDSIADLLALPTSARRSDVRVEVKGYHAGTDVGGGNFYWDDSSEEEDFGVTFAVSGIPVGRWRRVINSVLCPEWFGAVGDGVVDDSAAVKNAVLYSSEHKQVLYGNKRYYCAGEFIYLQSHAKLSGGFYDQASFQLEGSESITTELASAAEVGDNFIDVVDASNFSVGDTIKLFSCVNAHSPDAAPFVLGDREDELNLGEFAVIREITENRLFLESRLIFFYPIVSGPNSNNFTVSEVRKIDLIDFVEMENLTIKLNSTTTNRIPCRIFYAGPNVVFRNCVFDASESNYEYATSMNVIQSFRCRFFNVSFLSILFRPISGSMGNISVRACHGVEFHNCKVNGSNQCIDVTHGSINGPSLRTKIYSCFTTNSNTDGLTTHWGTYQTHIKNCVIENCSDRGIRCRGMGDIVEGCVVTGKRGSSNGIYLNIAAFTGAKFINNKIYGFLRGIEIKMEPGIFFPISDWEEDWLGAVVENNYIEGCSFGVELSSSPTSIRMNTVVSNNIIKNATRGIQLGSYHNGSIIRGNVIRDCERGIQISRQLSDCIIEFNYMINCERSLRGETGALPQIDNEDVFGARENAGFSIMHNYYINSLVPVSMAQNLTGLQPNDFTN